MREVIAGRLESTKTDAIQAYFHELASFFRYATRLYQVEMLMILIDASCLGLMWERRCLRESCGEEVSLWCRRQDRAVARISTTTNTATRSIRRNSAALVLSIALQPYAMRRWLYSFSHCIELGCWPGMVGCWKREGFIDERCSSLPDCRTTNAWIPHYMVMTGYRMSKLRLRLLNTLGVSFLKWYGWTWMLAYVGEAKKAHNHVVVVVAASSEERTTQKWQQTTTKPTGPSIHPSIHPCCM